MASFFAMLHELEKAVALGIVEGLTEFLPVSSTGHLILFGAALEFDNHLKDTFKVFIQSGAILAVVLLYWRRFLGFLDFSHDAGGFSGWAGISKVFVACVPAFLLGALLHTTIKTHLFAPVPVAIAFLVGAVVILLIERKPRPSIITSLDQISLRQAFMVGVLQCVALWPGMSRSGATILAGMWFGFERKVAAEFSFIVGVPVLCAAAGYDLLRNWQQLRIGDVQPFGIGFVAAFIAALISVRVLVAMMQHWSLKPFAYYRIVVGVALLFFLQ